MPSEIQAANEAQNAASDPTVSAFVEASAGSGKTKLLTDRALRLLLSGASPSRILSLTFTKAAAAEMEIRIRATAAAWAVCSEEDLSRALGLIGEDPTPNRLSQARKLFDRILDTPGGMQVGTIHGFSQSLLRRFPVEAGVSPHFQIPDETASAMRLLESKNRALSGVPHGVVDVVSKTLGSLQLDESLVEFSRADAYLRDLKTRFGDKVVDQMLREALGVGGMNTDDFEREIAMPPDPGRIGLALQDVATLGSDAAKRLVAPGLAWLDYDQDARVTKSSDWVSVFLTTAGTPRALKFFANAKLLETNPNIGAAVVEEQERLIQVAELRRAAAVAQVSGSMFSLYSAIANEDAAAKQRAGELDYGDLIARTEDLLRDPGAEWVLYKLDGGIDHVLLDEVQDISPQQWEIVGAIVKEFFAGQNEDRSRRTVFAVGDPKQSIYSFQGADLDSFTHWRRRLGDMVIHAGEKWIDGRLEVSFRSTSAVLSLVDEVFAGPSESGVGNTTHLVSRRGQGGSITMWPLAETEAIDDAPDWHVNSDYVRQKSARHALAEEIARWTTKAIGTERLDSRNRTLEPGDLLVLVRSRNDFGPSLVRALKDEGVPVAGLDRLHLKDSMAVKDLIALGDALLLPRNDRAVATWLVSPLVGLTDDDLFNLAADRKGSLIASLFDRQGEHALWDLAAETYRELQKMADFQSPYRFYSHVLGEMGGRRKLTRWLGVDEAELIDEFLAAALKYERSNNPTLQGFMRHLGMNEQQIKREVDTGTGRVRIMTVHAAKGLQAPYVILPDTTFVSTVKDNLFFLPSADGRTQLPVFLPRADMVTKRLASLKSAFAARIQEESNRLLYVALTRAEDSVLVSGIKPAKGVSPDCWYSVISKAFENQDSVGPNPNWSVPWGGEIRTRVVLQMAEPDRVQVRKNASASPFPPFIKQVGNRVVVQPAPAAGGQLERIVPSRLETDAPAPHQAPSGPSVFSGGRQAAMKRGVAMHALLQHLPSLKGTAEERRERALAFMKGRGFRASVVKTIVRDAFRIIENPQIADLYGPNSRAEVPIVGVVDNVEVSGVIDRLYIGNGVVKLLDYKTDRFPKDKGHEIPSAYQSQIRAYVAVLAKLVPDHRIEAMIAWTSNGNVVPVAADGTLPRPARRQMAVENASGPV